jgi:hypothetical protein
MAVFLIGKRSDGGGVLGRVVGPMTLGPPDLEINPCAL